MSHRNKGIGKKPKPHARLRTRLRWINVRDMKLNGKHRWWKFIDNMKKEVPHNA